MNIIESEENDMESVKGLFSEKRNLRKGILKKSPKKEGK